MIRRIRFKGGESLKDVQSALCLPRRKTGLAECSQQAGLLRPPAVVERPGQDKEVGILLRASFRQPPIDLGGLFATTLPDQGAGAVPVGGN